jgi:chorismate mutase-like protein
MTEKGILHMQIVRVSMIFAIGLCFHFGAAAQDISPAASPQQMARSAANLGALHQIMNERLSLMTDVARYKWNAKAPIEDVPREKQIIDSLKTQAQDLGVPASWAERFFRAQIEAAKVIQREQFTEWERNGVKRFESVPDLATEIRPRLDALTPRLLRALAAAWPELADSTQRERIDTIMHDMPGAGAHAMAALIAIAPLVDGSASAGRH